MRQTLTRLWWLLALCGFLDTMHAVMNLLMLNLDRSLGLRAFAPRHVVWDMGVLALTAGACAMAAGVSNLGRDHSWLLTLHGLALSAFGLIAVSPLVRGPLSFRPVSLLFLMMALSLAAFALATARRLPRGGSDRWFLNLAGAASICFALSFVAVGFRWVRLPTPQSFYIWMTCYFAFCAIFMLWLGVRLRNCGNTHAFADGLSRSRVDNPENSSHIQRRTKFALFSTTY